MLVLLSVLLPYRAPAALAAPPVADLPERPARLSLPTPGLADAETDAVAELAWRVNAVRERHGAPSLELGDALNASASVRAVEVQDGGPLSHERPEGDLLALLEEEGVDCTLAGEALARVAAPNPSTAVAMAYDLFMGSEAHRDLLLHPGFAHLGVAISQSGRRWLVVQVLTN